MATITARKRGDGTIGYTAQIRLKRAGKVVHTESQTFDRKQAAEAWAKKRETELAVPGALERAKADDPTLKQAIERYVAESQRQIGKTKTQVLRTIMSSELAGLRCSKITSADIVSFAQELNCQPQTRANYLAHLSSIFAVAKPAWQYELDYDAMKAAQTVCKRLGITTRARERDRRPSLGELDRLMRHFADGHKRRPSMVPMVKIIAFAIFSTRRLEEITRIRWEDLGTDRVMVRDMKNPGEKEGNDVWVDLVPEAMRIIEAMPRVEAAIFPYSPESIGALFTRACKLLGIEDLHFHDLRHDGISRLFELGWNIPHVAMASGHRDWKSLKRYTHIRQSGDKYDGWAWMAEATRPLPAIHRGFIRGEEWHRRQGNVVPMRRAVGE